MHGSTAQARVAAAVMAGLLEAAVPGVEAALYELGAEHCWKNLAGPGDGGIRKLSLLVS